MLCVIANFFIIRAISTHDSGRPAKKERRSSESTERRQPVVRKRIEKAKPEYFETKESKTEDSKSLRLDIGVILIG